MIAKLNNELLYNMELLKINLDSFSSSIKGALKRISDDEKKGIFLLYINIFDDKIKKKHPQIHFPINLLSMQTEK